MRRISKELAKSDFDSRSDEARVEGACQRHIGGALNDGAAIGEEGQGVGAALEAEKKIVEPDLSVGREAIAHGSEVDGTMMLMNLD
jgi:hypothetical protein